MNSEIKLLPCPFCGGEAEIRHYEDYTKDFASVYKYYVECTECKAQSNMKANMEDIIKDWNTRKPMDRIVEKLEELDDDCGCGKNDVWKAIEIERGVRYDNR